jgi:DNA-binding LytR/AlgR family response regulator
MDVCAGILDLTICFGFINLAMKIAIRGFKDVTVIEQEDILYCKADGRYTQIFLGKDKSILTSRLLKDIESALSGKTFCRIHHSYLINLNHIIGIRNHRKLILKNNIEIPIAKRRSKNLFSSIRKLNIAIV